MMYLIHSMTCACSHHDCSMAMSQLSESRFSWFLVVKDYGFSRVFLHAREFVLQCLITPFLLLYYNS